MKRISKVLKEYLDEQKEFFNQGLISREEYLDAQRKVNRLMGY